MNNANVQKWFVKPLSLLVVCTLVLISAASMRPARATANTPSLAQLAPAGTPLFAQVDLSASTFATLDAIIKKVGTAVGTSVPSIEQLLQLSLSNSGIDYQSDIKPWLGDSAAVFANDVTLMAMPATSTATPAFVVAVQITDKAAALKFLKGKAFAGTTNLLEATETLGVDSYDTFTSPGAEVILAVGEEYILLGTKLGLDSIRTPARTNLTTDAKFRQALDALPESDYPLFLYADFGAIMQPLIAQMSDMGGASAAQIAYLQEIYSAIGPFAIGGVLVGDNTLSLDIAQFIDYSKITMLGTNYAAPKPVNPAFISVLPADISFLIHGTDLKYSIETGIASFKAAAELQTTSGANAPDFERGYNQVVGAIQAATGLNLETDILAWMTGDYALVNRYTPSTNDLGVLGAAIVGLESKNKVALNVDQLLMIEATDPAQAAKVVKNLGATLVKALKDSPNPDVKVVADAASVTITLSNQDLARQIAQPIEIVITSNDTLFLIGTKPIVDEVLAGKGGLADSAAYKRAQATYLSGVTQELYVGPSAFDLVADLIAVSQFQNNRVMSSFGSKTPTPTPANTMEQEILRGATQYRALLASILDSLSITSANGADGAIIGRASITLK